MSVQTRQVLSVVGQSLPIYCVGQTTVGIRIAGTFVGTAVFEASTDGINFIPVAVTPFPSGTNVLSATAGGNWFFNVQNYQVFRVRPTVVTSGSMQIYLAAATDASYQDAYLTPGTLNATALAANATASIAPTAQANRALNLQALTITVNGQPAWLTSPNVQIFDGTNTGTLLAQFDLPLSGSAGIIYNVPLPPPTLGNPQGGYTSTPGNTLTVQVAAAGAGKNCIVNGTYTAA
jgi:hypothetical protein